MADLLLSGNTLYGTATGGGTWLNGTIFKLGTNGTGFTVLHTFTNNSYNTDGSYPQSVLVLSSNTLYGTASGFAGEVNGTVFAVNTDGTGFTTLHTFIPVFQEVTNSGGLYPDAGLVLRGDTMYGTANEGGAWGYGTIFKVNTNGSGFTVLHNFTYSDGANPYCDLILSGNTLYGTTGFGGSSGNGTVFAVNTDGTGFVTLHSLTDTEGYYLTAGLVLSGSTLYGTTWQTTYAHGGGTVFSISLAASPPQLTIVAAGANAILTWPTNASSFNLQSTTDLGPSAIWTTNLPAPVVVNGMNTVTTPTSGTQQFFRLGP